MLQFFFHDLSCGEEYLDVPTHSLASELRVALCEQNLQGPASMRFCFVALQDPVFILFVFLTSIDSCFYAAPHLKAGSVTEFVFVTLLLFGHLKKMIKNE